MNKIEMQLFDNLYYIHWLTENEAVSSSSYEFLRTGAMSSDYLPCFLAPSFSMSCWSLTLTLLLFIFFGSGTLKLGLGFTLPSLDFFIYSESNPIF